MIAQAPATSSPARIRDRIADLASVGAQAGGAVTRLAYTRAERDAHERFARWAEEDGARRVDVDAAGNSIAVFGEERPITWSGRTSTRSCAEAPTTARRE
jgi:hypothetical protein